MQDQAVIVGREDRVLGWGTTETCSRESSEMIETVELDIVDHAKCKSLYGGSKKITKNMICASRLDKGICKMDSGGPLVFNANELVGVVSWDTGCADENHPGIYTKVSAYRDWIKQISGV